MSHEMIVNGYVAYVYVAVSNVTRRWCNSSDLYDFLIALNEKKLTINVYT